MLKNDFACGKSHPPKGWKKEYLRRHAESGDHAKHSSLAISTAKTAVFMFKLTKLNASEAQMIGLLVNNHFYQWIVYEKILVDFQLAFYDDEDMQIEQESSATILPGRDCQLSKTNRSSYNTWEFVHVLNSVVDTDDIRRLKQARYFSLLLDESTDVSNSKICWYITSS